MLVFYHNLGPNQAGGPTWFIGPLILLIPLLLQLFGAGVFALPFQLLSLLVRAWPGCPALALAGTHRCSRRRLRCGPLLPILS